MNALGWRAAISLRDGLKQTYDWFLAQPTAKAVAG
jgi:nucleoside-diphosphate-sugar epimerase